MPCMRVAPVRLMRKLHERPLSSRSGDGSVLRTAWVTASGPYVIIVCYTANRLCVWNEPVLLSISPSTVPLLGIPWTSEIRDEADLYISNQRSRGYRESYLGPLCYTTPPVPFSACACDVFIKGGLYLVLLISNVMYGVVVDQASEHT